MVRMYLVTANVGSIFENIGDGMPLWLNEFSSVVRSRDPEFLAIHFQETGGKSCEFANNDIKEFFRQLVDRMEQLNLRLAEGFVDSTSNIEDQFTALSSIYFVHESLRLPVHIWDFQDGRFHEVSRCLNPSSTDLHPNVHMGPRLNLTNRKQKEKFPQNFYPNSKWSRKGFLRTRWRFGRTIVDLVNIHLFHDSCNLTAASVFPSPFAQHREKTLTYTIERIQSDGLEKSPLFVFGDFNFRINANGVVEILKKEHGDPVPKANETHSLVLGAKKFQCPEQELKFKHSFNWLKPFDFEPKQLSGLLQEHDLNFHPTYPFSEDVNEPEKFSNTRLPAWCDRVLFTPSTRDIFVKDFPIDYNLIGGNVCMGDHKPVGLHLKIQTTSDLTPTSNSSLMKGDVESTSNIDTTPIINKGNSVTMTRIILELPESENMTPTILNSLGGPFAKTAETAAITVNDDNNAISSNASSSSSRTLQNDSNFNAANGNSESGDGLGKSSTDFINILLPLSEESNNLEVKTDNLTSLESPTSLNSSVEESNCFFGALFRRRGKMRYSHNQGNGKGGGIGSTRNNSCRAFSGFKALSKCKRGVGGGITSINRSGSLLEPIAGAGCDFACSSLPSSGVPSQRPSMVAGDTTCSLLEDTNSQLSDNHQQINQSRNHYFHDFFTVPPTYSNGKTAACKNKDCYRKCGSISCCSPVKCLSTPFPLTSTGTEATTTDCRCQNRLMLNITTMITNNCNRQTNNGDLPLGSNLSLIAINSNTDLDKQTLDGKMIHGCCNGLESGCVFEGKIPVCWATTTTNTYNNSNSNNLAKLSSVSSCANCNNLMNNKNMQNNLLHSSAAAAAGEKNSNSGKKNVSKKSNRLSFNFRNRSASQESATLQAKCKCTIKEGMSRTTGGCLSCSKCVIL